MNLSPCLRQRFADDNNVPLAGGMLYTYVANTTTPQVTYSNQTGTTNANPVVLDAYGYCDLWLDPSLSYKFVLKDSSGDQEWTVDDVTGASGFVYSPNTVYSMGTIVQDASGFGLLYVSLTNNSTGNPLTNPSYWGLFQGNVRTVSASQTTPPLLVTDNLVRSNSTAGNLIHTLPAISTSPIGLQIVVKDVGTGGNFTQVKGSGSDLVDGNNTWVPTLSGQQSAAFFNNGTSWDSI